MNKKNDTLKSTLSPVTGLLSQSRGFTFLELLVTMAIIAGTSIVLTQVFFTTTRSSTKTEVSKEVKQTGDFALQTMERMMRSARLVTSVCSDLGSTAPSITIENPDSAETTFGCILDGVVPKIASSSANGVFYLSSNNVTLGGDSCDTSTLSFTCTEIAGSPSKILIEFTLSQKNSSAGAFEKANGSFQSTVTLRQ